jgi:hypothetical protein
VVNVAERQMVWDMASKSVQVVHADGNAAMESREASSAPWSWPERCVFAALAVAAALSLALCVCRCLALPSDLRLFSTSGEEGVVIYTVWKAAHGHPIYQIPGAGLHDTAIYNFLFYKCYGGLCAALGADGDRLVAVSRLLTCLSGLIGAFAQWKILGFLIRGPVTRREQLMKALMVTLTWYGSSYLNWWLVSVRPDVPATSLAMVGVWCWLEALRRRSSWLAALASIPFYSAWGLKQSVVWSLSGVVASGLVSKATRRLAVILAIITAMGFAVTLISGTPAYLKQTLYLSSINKIIPWDSFNRSQQLLLPLLLIWFFALLPVILRLWSRTRGLLAPSEESEAEALRAIAISCLIAVAMGIIAIGKEGSGRNHLMEGFVLAATLATSSLVRVMRMAPGAPRTTLVIMAFLFAVILCGRPFHSLIQDDTGITQGTKADLAQHRLMEQVLAGMPKPAFCDDEILSQTWYTTDNTFPGYIPDILMYGITKRHGLITDGGLSYLITHGCIKSILVGRNAFMTTELLNPAAQAGFIPGSLPPELAKLGFVMLVKPSP